MAERLTLKTYYALVDRLAIEAEARKEAWPRERGYKGGLEFSHEVVQEEESPHTQDPILGLVLLSFASRPGIAWEDCPMHNPTRDFARNTRILAREALIWDVYQRMTI